MIGVGNTLANVSRVRAVGAHVEGGQAVTQGLGHHEGAAVGRDHAAVGELEVVGDGAHVIRTHAEFATVGPRANVIRSPRAL